MGEEEGTVRLGVRLPASIHHKLQAQAREHHRSLNAEIVFVLGAGLSSEQMLSEAEQKIHESEQRVDERGREIEEHLKVYRARLEELAIDLQKIKERTPILLNTETIGLIEDAQGVAERRGKTLGDLFDEAFRKILNEQKSVKETRLR